MRARCRIILSRTTSARVNADLAKRRIAFYRETTAEMFDEFLPKNVRIMRCTTDKTLDAV